MLSKRGANVVYLGLLTLVIAGVAALVLVIVQAGVDSHLPTRWGRAWAVAWIASFPTALLFAGALRRFADGLAR